MGNRTQQPDYSVREHGQVTFSLEPQQRHWFPALAPSLDFICHESIHSSEPVSCFPPSAWEWPPGMPSQVATQREADSSFFSYWKHILCHWKRLGSCGGEEIHSWLRDPLLLPCIYQAPWAQGFLKALDFLRKERQPNLSVVSPFQGRHPCLMVTNDTHSGKWCQLFTAQPARWNRLVHQGGTAGFGLSVHGDVLGAIQNLPSCPWHPENNICH